MSFFSLPHGFISFQPKRKKNTNPLSPPTQQRKKKLLGQLKPLNLNLILLYYDKQEICETADIFPFFLYYPQQQQKKSEKKNVKATLGWGKQRARQKTIDVGWNCGDNVAAFPFREPPTLYGPPPQKFVSTFIIYPKLSGNIKIPKMLNIFENWDFSRVPKI